jgi:hypothetical protein
MNRRILPWLLNWQIVVSTSGVAQGDSLAIVGWLVKHYYHVQQ